jgi:hypothetical protein
VVRRALLVMVVLACAAGVFAFQASRPQQAPADPNVFVPSPQVFLDFSPSFRTSIADAYYLGMVQYFGEHVEGDGRLDSLPAMVDLVTALSPHFTHAYFFGALALVDAGRPDVSYEILQRGFRENPDDYRFPAYLGYFVYRFGEGESKNRVAGEWYQKAAEVPGRPDFIPRLAATILGKGGELEKSVVMWGQVYMAGDKYSRQKAVNGLERILPKGREERMKALAPLVGTMPEEELNALIADLFGDHS